MKNGSVLGRWEIEISELGIKESNDLCTSTYNWEIFLAVEKDMYNLYLFIDNYKALILPHSQINAEIESIINRNVISVS